jgi:RNA polymerase sigma factor (TIGR02999 family)
VSKEVHDGHLRGQVTELLLAWSGGKRSALDQLVPLMYPELRRLAHGYMRGERDGHSLQTSALINEAYIRLVDASRVKWQNRAHFLAISAELMHRILVDYARSRQTHKRGDGVRPLPLEAALDLHHMRSRELVKLDDALNDLALEYPRMAKVVEMRFFGGLSVEETAEALGVSVDNVTRDWRFARAWLHRALSSESAHEQ